MDNIIRENIAKIRRQIPSQVCLVAVTKGRSLAQIQEALDSGITHIGENRVQEAALKYKEIKPAVTWHLVGHLQTNKAKEAVKIFDLIHSVDSLNLAREIDKQAGKINKLQDILIEVNTSAEESKFGIRPEDLFEFIKAVSDLKNISLKGLMTIAPMVDNTEEVRPYFRILNELRDKANELRLTGDAIQVLSMGMSDDFEVAIEEGANMVRIGRAIFEDK